MNIKYKIASGAVTVLMLGGLFAPMANAADIAIDNNGEGSTNTVNITNVNNTVVLQGNATVALTVVSSNASTGGNNANGNTGDGDVSITSGNAKSTVKTVVTGGDNLANVDPCGCNTSDPTVKVKDNGKNSKNTVSLTDVNSQVVGQGNLTAAGTFVGSDAKTGKNKANGNTGKGDKTISTGNAKSKVTTKVTGGSNVLNP